MNNTYLCYNLLIHDVFSGFRGKYNVIGFQLIFETKKIGKKTLKQEMQYKAYTHL